MVSSEISDRSGVEVSAEAVREQLEILVQDRVFRTSKRSIQFLRFVVEKTLEGDTDQIKERTIGVEVFGRDPSYDTNVDHVVRTAAIELRKRLAIYYGEEAHRAELRMNLVPGSYIPRFLPPTQPAVLPEAGPLLPVAPHDPPALSPEEVPADAHEVAPDPPAHRLLYLGFALATLLVIAAVSRYMWWKPESAQELFWKPVLETPGAALLAIGGRTERPALLSRSYGGDHSNHS